MGEARNQGWIRDTSVDEQRDRGGGWVGKLQLWLDIHAQNERLPRVPPTNFSYFDVAEQI